MRELEIESETFGPIACITLPHDIKLGHGEVFIVETPFAIPCEVVAQEPADEPIVVQKGGER